MAAKPRENYWKTVGTLLGAFVGLGITTLLLNGRDPDYGLAVFVLMPLSVGIVTSVVVARKGLGGFRSSACYSSLALGLIGATYFFDAGEGLVCIAMAAIPLLLVLLIGVGIGYAIAKARDSKRNGPMSVVALIIFLPPVAADELFHRDHATQVAYSTSVDIAASPEVVWQEIEHLGALPPAHDWMSKLGLACPETTELKGRGVGAERDCTLSTGPMRETITAWEPGKKLGFVALQTPPPMRELNPFGDPHPAHLQQRYFRILYGEFTLKRLDTGMTRLTRTTRFEHRIRPAVYWTSWCNLAADYAHRRVLDTIKLRSEGTERLHLARRGSTGRRNQLNDLLRSTSRLVRKKG